MTNVYKFHNEPLSLEQIFSINKGRIANNMTRYNSTIADQTKTTRQKLEAKMMKALFSRDQATFDRITALIAKFDQSKLKVVK